jgi:histone-lysine N-methyltransferase EZH2
MQPKKIKKYARKGGIHLITTKVAGDAPRVPRYNSNTIVKRNILCGDEDKLQFIPFLANPAGETDQGSLLADLGEVYSTKPSGFSKESERALEIRNYVDDWLEGLDVGCNRQTLIRYLIEKSTDDLGKNHKLRRLEKSFGGPLAPTLVEVAKRISDAFDKILGVSLKDVILPEKCLKQIIENAEKTCPDGSLGRSQSESPKSQFNRTEYTVERLGTFINLTCLICGVVSCQTHGDYTKVDDEYQPTYVAMRYDELLRSQDARLSWNSPATVRTQPSSVESSPCSDLCYRKDCYRMPVELAREHEIALKSFMISMRPNVEQPCSISFLLDVPCWQIHSKIQEWNAAPKVAPKDPTLTRSRGPRGIDWYDNKQKTLKPDWRELTTAHQHEERVQANPVSVRLLCTSVQR